MYNASLKQEILEFYAQHGIKATREKYKIQPTVVYYWLNPKKRKSSSEKWKKENPDKVFHSLRRKRQPFKVLSCYVNGNAKKVMERHNRFSELEFNRVKAFDLWKIARRQKLICAISGLPLTAETMSVDHILPLSQGGSNHPENLRLLDTRINRIKLDYSDSDFIQLCQIVAQRNPIGLS